MPAVGEQGEKLFVAGLGQHGWEAGEHVAVVDPRIMAVTLAGGQQAEMDRRRAAAPVAPHKKPIAASYAEAP